MSVVYEFKCRKCDTKIEQRSNDPGTHCGEKTKRVWSLGGIVFKGSGFYSKDNR